MTVTPDKTPRAARAREALIARHAELREVLDHWPGVLAAAADTGGPARNLLRAFLADEVLPHARAEEARCTGQPGAIRTPACWCRR